MGRLLEQDGVWVRDTVFTQNFSLMQHGAASQKLHLSFFWNLERLAYMEGVDSFGGLAMAVYSRCIATSRLARLAHAYAIWRHLTLIMLELRETYER